MVNEWLPLPRTLAYRHANENAATRRRPRRSSMMNMRLPRLFAVALTAVLDSLAPEAALAQADQCRNRGQLDALYCDDDGDLVADAPKDAKRWRDPATLVFAYTPVEDPAVYQNIFKPFTDYLGQCTAKRVVYYPVQSNSAEIEAMRSGRLHVAGFSTGPTGFAVNMAGAVPFAAKGTEKGPHGYHLLAIVKTDSPYQKLADLKGKRVAHTSPASNSGNLAPRVLFPEHGLKPDEDYKPLMSGGHDKSALGVASGDYDMAPVASDVFERMVTRGSMRGGDFRILYKSPVFPTSSFAYAHDLKPELAAKVKECFLAYRFTPEMTKEFNGDDRFFPITYRETWAVVREVAEKSGTPYNKTAYEAEAKREAEALAKKQQQTPAQPKQ
jgi:phosphonate transport system substrate-binding protein